MTFDYEGALQIQRLQVGDFGNNCYIVSDTRTNESAIIDAPTDPHKILEALEGRQLKLILITHTHRDHWGALSDVRKSTGARVGVHDADKDKLPDEPDIMLNDQDTLMVGQIPLRIIHTPGHTPGSICLVTGRHLFTGDTLFPGGPGYSMSPENLRQEIHSITTKLFSFPDDTLVYPGHGEGTILGAAKEEYHVFATRDHPQDLSGDVLWLSS